MKLTKKILLLSVIIAFVLACVNTAFCETPPFIANIKKVREGMTKKEVGKLLGTNYSTTYSNGTEIMRYYQSGPSSPAGAIGGKVASSLMQTFGANVLSSIGSGLVQGGHYKVIEYGMPIAADGLYSSTENSTSPIDTYTATIVLKEGFVESTDYSVSGKNAVENMSNRKSASNVRNVSETVEEVRIHEPPENSSPVVYGPAPFFAVNGVYHVPDCKEIFRIEKRAMRKFSNSEDAEKEGFNKCSMCGLN